MKMISFIKKKKRLLLALSTVLLGAIMVSQYVKTSDKARTTKTVNIQGVNYTDLEFSYEVQDPENKNNRGGGEIVNAFAAGGIRCCYELPLAWQPGMKLRIGVTRPKRETLETRYEEEHEEHLVEVPQYAQGKPGDLWVVRNADETMSVVLSDVQPDHEQWPGKVKGWPVPSLAYQRKIYDMYVREAEQGVRLYERLLADLKANPAKKAREDWAYSEKIVKKNYPNPSKPPSRSFSGEIGKENYDLLKRFKGPDDPAFRAWLKADYEEGLQSAKERLAEVMKGRP